MKITDKAAFVKQAQSSGNVSKFLAKKGISASQFYYWRSHLTPQTAKRGRPKTAPVANGTVRDEVVSKIVEKMIERIERG